MVPKDGDIIRSHMVGVPLSERIFVAECCKSDEMLATDVLDEINFCPVVAWEYRTYWKKLAGTVQEVTSISPVVIASGGDFPCASVFPEPEYYPSCPYLHLGVHVINIGDLPGGGGYLPLDDTRLPKSITEHLDYQIQARRLEDYRASKQAGKPGLV